MIKALWLRCLKIYHDRQGNVKHLILKIYKFNRAIETFKLNFRNILCLLSDNLETFYKISCFFLNFKVYLRNSPSTYCTIFKLKRCLDYFYLLNLLLRYGRLTTKIKRHTKYDYKRSEKNTKIHKKTLQNLKELESLRSLTILFEVKSYRI